MFVFLSESEVDIVEQGRITNLAFTALAVALEGQIFGINTDSNDIPLGILGLAPYLGGSLPKYSFVLDTMVAQREINSRVFSLDLRSIDSPDGTLPNLQQRYDAKSIRLRYFWRHRHQEVHRKS